MSPFARSVPLLWLLIILLSTSNIALGKTHVKVVNHLTSNLDLTFHCKSKDDDLGVQLLHPSESWEWSFHASDFFWTTILLSLSMER
ncbi:Plant self-incompatibility protein S1 [Sesbania bispinosa]|nr:Plant self-incompatibility protein S1 [Sesbania bispinosa]